MRSSREQGFARNRRIFFTFFDYAEEPLLTELKLRIRDVRVGPDGAVYVLTDSGNPGIQPNTPHTAKLLKLIPK